MHASRIENHFKQPIPFLHYTASADRGQNEGQCTAERDIYSFEIESVGRCLYPPECLCNALGIASTWKMYTNEDVSAHVQSDFVCTEPSWTKESRHTRNYEGSQDAMHEWRSDSVCPWEQNPIKCSLMHDNNASRDDFPQLSTFSQRDFEYLYRSVTSDEHALAQREGSVVDRAKQETSRGSTFTASIIGSHSNKRGRKRLCIIESCSNWARIHRRCKKHGGANLCKVMHCIKNSQSRGLCIAHGGGLRCKYEGCTRASQTKGLCKAHGGGKDCIVNGCLKKAHLKHLCRNHGGGIRCRTLECTKWAQKNGFCVAHAKENV